MDQSVQNDIFDGDDLLRRMMGDRDLAAEIVSEFLVDLATQISGLKASIEEGDEQCIARRIHTIKGASANIGAKALARLARGAEKVGVAKQREQADAFVASLLEHFEVFKSTVHKSGFLDH